MQLKTFYGWQAFRKNFGLVLKNFGLAGPEAFHSEDDLFALLWSEEAEYEEGKSESGCTESECGSG